MQTRSEVEMADITRLDVYCSAVRASEHKIKRVLEIQCSRVRMYRLRLGEHE